MPVASSERVLLALTALVMTIGSVELIRREILLHRSAEGLGGILAGLLVMLFLLVTDERAR